MSSACALRVTSEYPFTILDGFVCVVIEVCQASFESSQIAVVDGVVDGVPLTTVIKRGGSIAPLVTAAVARPLNGALSVIAVNSP